MNHLALCVYEGNPYMLGEDVPDGTSVLLLIMVDTFLFWHDFPSESDLNPSSRFLSGPYEPCFPPDCEAVGLLIFCMRLDPIETAPTRGSMVFMLL